MCFTEFLDHVVIEGFLQKEHRAMVLVDETPRALLHRFDRFDPPTVEKAAWALKRNNR